MLPVYNVEKYLSVCLDSLLRQNIPQSDYEIICINDGSTDKSGLILDDYAKRYSGIHVFHKENGGVSSARNVGIEKAEGDYIWFVDPDDFIRENILEKLRSIVNEEDIDLLTMNAYTFGDYSHDPSLSDEERESLYHQNGMRTSKYNSMIWMHLFRRATILENKLSFNCRIKKREDALFFFQFDAVSEKKKEIDDVVYFYRKRQGSLMSMSFDGAKEGYILYLTLFKKYYDEGYGDKFYSTRILSKSIKWQLFRIARMSHSNMKKDLNELKDLGLFPLPWNYFNKEYDIWPVNKRANNGIYNRFYNWAYNKLYTYLGFMIIRIDFKFKKAIRLLLRKDIPNSD